MLRMRRPSRAARTAGEPRRDREGRRRAATGTRSGQTRRSGRGRRAARRASGPERRSGQQTFSTLERVLTRRSRCGYLTWWIRTARAIRGSVAVGSE